MNFQSYSHKSLLHSKHGQDSKREHRHTHSLCLFPFLREQRGRGSERGEGEGKIERERVKEMWNARRQDQA